jgi:hypothetical protein
MWLNAFESTITYTPHSGDLKSIKPMQKRVRWLVRIRRLPTKYDSVQTGFSGQVKLATDWINYAAEIISCGE